MRVLRFKTTENKEKYKFIVLSFKKVKFEEILFRGNSHQNSRDLNDSVKK